jgi:CheY-like chemotaxis protein
MEKRTVILHRGVPGSRSTIGGPGGKGPWRWMPVSKDRARSEVPVVAATPPEWFRAQVQEALDHLYDYIFLQGHLLAPVIDTGAEGWNRGTALHRLLVEVIDRLKPPPGTPAHSPLWRRYRTVFMRHVESTTVSQVAEELGVSERQARRDNHDAVEAVAQLLWQRFGGAVRPPALLAPSATIVTDPTSSGDAPVDRLAVRVGSPGPHGPTRLDEVVASVRLTIQNLAEVRGVRFDAPASDRPALVATERTVLRQIILTVVVGGIEIAQPGDVVRLSSEATATQAQVTVEVPGAGDAGARVSAALASRLATARELLGPREGTLTEEWTGDALRLTLQLSAVSPTTVLLVDDNPGMLRLLRRYLGCSKYAVIEAQSPAEALAFAQDYQPDLITLDVMMPAKDGWEVLQTLRAQPRTRHIPVLVCSVLKEQDLALSLGAAGFLPKPVNQEALLQALASLERGSAR